MPDDVEATQPEVAPVPRPPAGTTTITIPTWLKWLGGIAIGYLPLLLTGYLAFHDMQRDFAKEQEKISKLQERIVVLEEKDHAKDLVSTKMSTDLTYIRQTIDDLKGTLERLATR
jgi:hypothetical protein